MAKAIKQNNIQKSRNKLKAANSSGKTNIKVPKNHEDAQAIEDTKTPYPVYKENIIEATAQIADLVHDLKRLEELKKQLLYKEDTLKSKIMNYMQDHSHLKRGDYLLASWKRQTRNIFDLPSFKSEYHSLYESFLKESSVRVFRLT